ncbi:MAG: non-ribosomal peptide synthetase, partial [bacterium]|nr:non-ribosomal peptide synthetase [bacterium]
GFRIECGEIEFALEKHHHVKEAVVVDQEDQAGVKYLCAYLVADEKLDEPELKTYLAAQLSEYMVPAQFVQLEKIPLTPNGKVDRKALDSLGTTLDSGSRYAAPGSETEKIVAGVWRDVLKLDKVGVDDNFFDIGGNSLKIIQLNHKLNEHLDTNITVAILFKWMTVRSFSRYLEKEKAGENVTGDTIDRSEKLAKAKKNRDKRKSKRRRGSL